MEETKQQLNIDESDCLWCPEMFGACWKRELPGVESRGQQLFSLREEGGFGQGMMGWFGEFEMVSEQN